METSPSLSGSTNEAPLAPTTSKATSSLQASSGSDKLSVLLAAAHTLSPDAARNWKPSPTAAKRKAESMDHGPAADQPMTPSELHPDSRHSYEDSVLDQHYQRWRAKMAALSSDTVEDWQRYPATTTEDDGATSPATTSTGQRGAANRRLYTTPADTQTYTLSQAKYRFGSMGTAANVFSSLTNIKASLGKKHSFEFWTDILTRLQASTASSTLSGLASCFAPTTTSRAAGNPSYGADSSEEGSGSSQEYEDPTSRSLSDSSPRSGSPSEYKKDSLSDLETMDMEENWNDSREKQIRKEFYLERHQRYLARGSQME